MAEILIAHLVPFALVAMRILGLFLTAPLVGGAMVPWRAKVLLGVALAAAVYPVVLARGGAIAPESASMLWLVPLSIFEMAIGASMGFLAGLPLHAANFAGFLMGHQMGLGLARTYDPSSEVETDLISQVLFIIAAGAFLAIDGLEALFLAIASSFESIPAGGFRPDLTPVEMATGLLGSGFELALRVSAPVLGIVTLVLVSLAVLNKTLPQINAMTVGFILKIVLGVSMLAIGITGISEALAEDVSAALREVLGWWERVQAGGV